METQLIGFVHHSTAALISLLIWIRIDPVFRLEPVWVSRFEWVNGEGRWVWPVVSGIVPFNNQAFSFSFKLGFWLFLRKQRMKSHED